MNIHNSFFSPHETSMDNGTSQDTITPVPPSESVIQLPKDHYLHIGAPSEWWWHTGTLVAGGRRFGFEINAAVFEANSPDAYGFTEVMLTDVQNKKHYKNQSQNYTKSDGFNPETWAESDPSKPWRVELGDVSMKAPQADPTKNMEVKAKFVDGDTTVVFDLTLSQDGPPFIVWGTGVTPIPSPPTLATNNYYYSLTRLNASGSITINGEAFEVSGVTWMDHEYGKFGTAANRPKWILQDMQLSNGVCISNFTLPTPGNEPALNKRLASFATVQLADGTTYFATNNTVTPFGRTWSSPEGQEYFMQLRVQLPDFQNADIVIESLVDAQEFPVADHNSIYEGVASASGTFNGEDVTGTAWSEQTLT